MGEKQSKQSKQFRQKQNYIKDGLVDYCKFDYKCPIVIDGYILSCMDINKLLNDRQIYKKCKELYDTSYAYIKYVSGKLTAFTCSNRIPFELAINYKYVFYKNGEKQERPDNVYFCYFYYMKDDLKNVYCSPTSQTYVPSSPKKNLKEEKKVQKKKKVQKTSQPVEVFSGLSILELYVSNNNIVSKKNTSTLPSAPEYEGEPEELEEPKDPKDPQFTDTEGEPGN